MKLQTPRSHQCLQPVSIKPSTSTTSTYVAHAHANEAALKKTAKKMGVNLEGEMHECKSCSMAIGLHMSIPKKTDNRASQHLEEVEGDESNHEEREANSEGSGSASGYEESKSD